MGTVRFGYILIFLTPMLTLDQCRKIDPTLKDLSDEELTQVQDEVLALVEIVYTLWQKKQGSKSPTSYLPDSV